MACTGRQSTMADSKKPALCAIAEIGSLESPTSAGVREGLGRTPEQPALVRADPCICADWGP